MNEVKSLCSSHPCCNTFVKGIYWKLGIIFKVAHHGRATEEILQFWGGWKCYFELSLMNIWILEQRWDNINKIPRYFSEKHAKMIQDMPKTMKNAKFPKSWKSWKTCRVGSLQVKSAKIYPIKELESYQIATDLLSSFGSWQRFTKNDLIKIL